MKKYLRAICLCLTVAILAIAIVACKDDETADTDATISEDIAAETSDTSAESTSDTSSSTKDKTKNTTDSSETEDTRQFGDVHIRPMV